MTRPALLAREGLHTTFFYLALFAAMGAHLPYWPIWLEDWGLSETDIGLFTALGIGIRVIGGVAIPVLADRLDARRKVLALTCLAGTVLFLAHIWIESKALLLLATLATGAVLAGSMPIGEALGSAASRRFGFDYAHSRGAGTLSFLAANILGGILIGWFGAGFLVWWIALALAAAAFLALGHPGGGHVETTPPRLTDITKLMLTPTFALFTFAISFSQSSHAVYYVYGSLHWRDLGISEGNIGLLWAFSVAMEIAFMLLIGARIVTWLGPVGAIALSAGAGVLRWTAMMFDPGLLTLFPLQILHALTFAAGHLGAIAFIAAAVPDRYNASAQGLFSGFINGILMAAAMALAALLYPKLGGTTYILGTIMSALGLAFCLALKRSWTGLRVLE